MGLTSLGRCPDASRGGRGIGSWQQPNEKIKGALRPCLAAPFITEPTTLAKLLGENRSASCLTERALNTVVQDTRFQSHYSLLKTVEAAFGLPYLGHAADATTNTLAPLLAPSQQ